MSALDVLDLHIPSLTESDENELHVRVFEWSVGDDVADFAVRTCACGVKIDGFYEYVGHLKDMIRQDEIANCAYCAETKGQPAPRHFASARCESGRRNHCSCDVCF